MVRKIKYTLTHEIHNIRIVKRVTRPRLLAKSTTT